MTRYVAKALVHTGSDSMDGEQGPFYRYLAAETLDDAVKKFFEKRNALFAGGKGGGDLGSFFLNLLNIESVYALAVKETGKHPWHVLMDMNGEFLRNKNHQKHEIELVREAYGERAFKTRYEYVMELVARPEI